MLRFSRGGQVQRISPSCGPRSAAHDGRLVPVVPPAPTWAGTTLASTDAHLETAGLRIDRHTATPDWHGERLDLDWAITVLHSATADPVRRNVPAGTGSTPDGTDTASPS